MLKPYITVLIDTYNHERFIEKAIASVLDQDFPAEKLEILVVDDGSTDQTAEIVRTFEPRLRLIRKPNGGQASAFNVGIPQAQGEIVAFLDGDDWWAPSKLREVAEVFEKNPGIGAVGHGYYEVRRDASESKLAAPARAVRLALDDPASARLTQGLCDFLGTSKLTVRKDVLERMGSVPEELFFSADVYVFCLAVAIAGATVLDLPLCYYRLHGENLWETRDPVRMSKRMAIMERVSKCIRPELSRLGVRPETFAALAEPWMLDIDRFYLMRDGGMPWRTFQVERTAQRLAYSQTSFGYKMFKALALGLTLVMPPRRFYQLKQWYSDLGLQRYREKLGTVVPSENLQMRQDNKLSSGADSGTV